MVCMMLIALQIPGIMADTTEEDIDVQRDLITLINEGFELGIPTGWLNTGWLEKFYGSPHSGSSWVYSWAAGDTLTTTSLDLGSNTQLSFWYASETSTNPETLHVRIDEALVWSDTDFTHTNYQNALVDLSPYTGVHTISFIGMTSAFYGQTLDDILITTEIDLTPPEITNVQAQPIVQTAGETVTITCDVTDNEAVGSVYVNITYPDSSFYSIPMAGSGSYSYAQSFGLNGEYLYHIYAMDSNGNSAISSTFSFRINLPPISNFNYAPSDPSTNDLVIFTDLSYDPDGIIVAWTWDFNDGFSSNDQHPTHMFDDGIYTVTLTVTDDDGAIDSFIDTVTVLNILPTAQFTFTPLNPSTADNILFTDTSYDPDGSIVAWAWDFGDSGNSNVKNPTHSYADDGTYLITLTVTDDDGGIDTTTGFISVSNVAPSSNFLFNPAEPTINDIIAYTDLSMDSDGIIVSWNWSFGDGMYSTEQHPFHQYLTADEYLVSLIVYDDDGYSDVIEKSIVVSAPVEVIDINQSINDRGFPIRHALDGDWAAAQSFVPTKSMLTKAEIYLRAFGTPEFDLVIELRADHPQGILFDTVTFTPSEVPSSWEWLEIDFSNTSTSFGYEWGYAFGNQYADGAFWFTRDGGALWRDLPTMYEFTFRTYGL